MSRNRAFYDVNEPLRFEQGNWRYWAMALGFGFDAQILDSSSFPTVKPHLYI